VLRISVVEPELQEVGTVTFCLRGTGTVIGMHYGSGTGFGSGSNTKCNKKSQKLKNDRKTFWEKP
jgi:hypothetical protein